MYNQKPTTIYNLEQRQLLSDAIRGVLPGTVKVSKHASMVCECLAEWGLSVDRQYVNQQIKRAANNQDLFRAVSEVLNKERPGLIGDLLNGKSELAQAA